MEQTSQFHWPIPSITMARNTMSSRLVLVMDYAHGGQEAEDEEEERKEKERNWEAGREEVEEEKKNLLREVKKKPG